MVEPAVFTCSLKYPNGAIVIVLSFLGSPLRRSALLTEGSIIPENIPLREKADAPSNERWTTLGLLHSLHFQPVI